MRTVTPESQWESQQTPLVKLQHGLLLPSSFPLLLVLKQGTPAPPPSLLVHLLLLLVGTGIGVGLTHFASLLPRMLSSALSPHILGIK